MATEANSTVKTITLFSCSLADPLYKELPLSLSLKPKCGINTYITLCAAGRDLTFTLLPFTLFFPLINTKLLDDLKDGFQQVPCC